MSSRGKKNLQSGAKSIVSADAKRIDELTKENAKLNSIFNICFVVLVLIMLVLLVTMPLVKATFVLEIDGVAIEDAQKTFTTSLLDIGMAPIRGINSGFVYIMDSIGISRSNATVWKLVLAVVENYAGENVIEESNAAGVYAYVLTNIIYALFILTVVAGIVDRAVKKNKYLFSLISISSFSASILVLFISAIVGAVMTKGKSITLALSLGLFFVGLVSAMLLALVIVYVVKYRKVTKECSLLLKEENNENL